VAARVHRGEVSITPLAGEILTSGEVLWLLVSHPTLYFEFAYTSWGDGSPEYGRALGEFLQKRKDWVYRIGQPEILTYATGLLHCGDYNNPWTVYLGGGLEEGGWDSLSAELPRIYLDTLHSCGLEVWYQQGIKPSFEAWYQQRINYLEAKTT
jgi:hypothetical protein